MYRTLFTLFFAPLLIFNGSLFSQEPILLSDETKIEINKSIQIFDDTSQSLEIKDILKYDIQSQFEYNKNRDIRVPGGKNTFWIKFKVKNISDVEKTYFLELKKSGIKNIQFFTQQSLPLVSGDLQSTQIRAHSLKPKMAYLGRPDIQETARNIEVSIKSNSYNNSDLSEWIESICAEYQKIEDELENYFEIKNNK